MPLRFGSFVTVTLRQVSFARFGEDPLDAFDRFKVLTHVNDFAVRYSQGRVKQARSHLKSIFDEAIKQEFPANDPTRKLKIPRNLRRKCMRVLRWEQLRLILAKTARRDRLLLKLDMVEAPRPGELFALRWRSFDDRNTVSLTETVYRRPRTAGSWTPITTGSGFSSRLGKNRALRN